MNRYEYRIYSGAAGKDATMRDVRRLLNLFAQSSGRTPQAITPSLGVDYLKGLNELGQAGWITIGFIPGTSDQILLMRLMQ